MDWGVVVASDQGAEWLLSWWWNCYRKHHTQPVAFVDFGMSEAAKKWCAQNGILIPFAGPCDFVAAKDQVRPKDQLRWEAIYGPTVWQARRSWFKKPLAMLHSPFETTVWLDLDCEVCQPIDAILEGLDSHGLGAVQVTKGAHYNSGVVVYGKKSPLLHAWADGCLKKHRRCIGDETLLSALVRKGGYPFKELDRKFNWMMGWGYHPELVIAHWAASWGKLCIESMGGIQRYLSDAVK